MDGWQRLDKWLWCARYARARADCARLVEGGLVRVNRQPTDKPHARVRPSDVLTLPARGDARADVEVWRVLALAERRGPAAEARLLYEVVDGLRTAASDCISPTPAEGLPSSRPDQE